MSSLAALLLSAVLMAATAIKIADMEQGAEFTRCLKIGDFMTKGLADDITLVDRLATGCCPKDYTPGLKWVMAWDASVTSAQIVCGFTAGGTISTNTAKGACTYNKCYVHKQNLPCANGFKQLLNGCCASETCLTDSDNVTSPRIPCVGGRGYKRNSGHPSTCTASWQKMTTENSDQVRFCTTYDGPKMTSQTPASKRANRTGTPNSTDDQLDGKLQPDKIDTYTKCAGGTPGASGSEAGDTAVATSGGDRAVGIFAIALAHTMWL